MMPLACACDSASQTGATTASARPIGSFPAASSSSFSDHPSRSSITMYAMLPAQMPKSSTDTTCFVAEAARRDAFQPQSLEILGRLGARAGPKHFYGDGVVQHQVSGAIDRAEAAGSDLLVHSVLVVQHRAR